MDMDKIRLQMFLAELSELSKKYGMYIQGCGCCGSPWVFDDKIKHDYDNLSYQDDENGYYVDD